jgi:hypothetical protein
VRSNSTNKTDRHDITGVLLKVALNSINQTISGNVQKGTFFVICINLIKHSKKTIENPDIYLYLCSKFRVVMSVTIYA